jgi:hypothetical protein
MFKKFGIFQKPNIKSLIKGKTVNLDLEISDIIAEIINESIRIGIGDKLGYKALDSVLARLIYQTYPISVSILTTSKFSALNLLISSNLKSFPKYFENALGQVGSVMSIEVENVRLSALP